MYEIDRPTTFFMALLEAFISQAERSLAYFFAVLVFLLIFLLALFGRDVLYPGLVGVLCLFLIKLRDIIDGYAELKHSAFGLQYALKASENVEKAAGNLQQMYTAFNEAAIAMMEQEFPKKFSPENAVPLGSENGLISYLQSCRKIIETASRLIPDEPMRQETKKALLKMTVRAKTYLLDYLTDKYAFSKAIRRQIEQSCRHLNAINLAVFQSLLEANGVDPTTAARAAKGMEIIAWIQKYVKPEQKKESEEDPAPALTPAEA